MKKAVFIFAAVLIVFLVNTNCTLLTDNAAPSRGHNAADKNGADNANKTNIPAADKSEPPVPVRNDDAAQPQKQYYGAYLAGRVANIRLDLDNAADYYMIAAQAAPEDLMLTNRIYLMLMARGRIPEAAQYALTAREQGDEDPFINLILSIHNTKQQRYHQAISEMDALGNNPMQNMITAWNYAALKQPKAALKALAPLKENKALLPLYYFQAGAISDYLDDKSKAAEYYQKACAFNGGELAMFPLQVISNFYLRNGEPDKAVTLIKKSTLLQDSKIRALLNKVMASGADTAPVLSSPEVGLSDALLEIGIVNEHGNSDSDISLFFAILAAYVNPDYSLPHLFVGNLMEKRELWDKAIQAYAAVKPEDFAYYGAQVRIGQNMIKNRQAEKAETVFRKLIEKYGANPEIYTNLAEALRLSQKYSEAARYYQMAIDTLPENERSAVWPLNMAIGICYTAEGNNAKAEEYLRKVLEVNDNRIVQNYLGYVLLQENKNIEEAFELIVKAYNQTPMEGTFVDSLGWAFYKIGRFDEAIKYLETAVDLATSEAVIYDHLGDAYWQSGRFDEAVFQWNHAIGLQDSSGELDKEKVKEKIKSGIPAPAIAPFDKLRVEEAIRQIRSPALPEDKN